MCTHTNTEERWWCEDRSETGLMQLQAGHTRMARTHRSQEMHGRSLPKRTGREHGSANTLGVGLYPPELWDNTFLLFSPTQHAVFCNGSFRKLIYWLMSCSLLPPDTHMHVPRISISRSPANVPSLSNHSNIGRKIPSRVTNPLNSDEPRI